MPYAIAAAAVAAGGSIYAADQAKSGQQAGTQKAIDASNNQLNVSKADLAPYRSAGTAALARLQQLMGIAPGAGGNDWKTLLKKGFADQFTAHPSMGPQALASLNDMIDKSSSPTDKSAYGISPLDFAAQMGVPYPTNMGDVFQAHSVASGAPASDEGSLLSKFSPADLNADTVYNSGLKFGLDEGTKALERHAAATGSYDSGAGSKAIARFANDYGSTKAADAYSRFTNDQDRTFGKLTGIAGMGSGSTNVGVGVGSTAGSNLASLYSGQGNANAASSLAQGNAISSGANSVGNYYQQQQLLSQLTGGGQRNTTTTNPNYSQADILAG